LQAADILVYKADRVPVGIDQAAHLELTRKIAKRFNYFYDNVFPEPRTLLTETPKLLGLDNRKMSKSFNNYIALSDPPKVVTQKVKRMITDPKRIHVSDPGHPAKCNVHSYYKVFKPEIAEDVAHKCRKAEIGCTACKEKLADILIELLEPIHKKRNNLLKDKKAVIDILEKGKARAKDIASKTMEEVKDKISFLTHKT
jgi:tryptophanyl-tRNA synthetase